MFAQAESVEAKLADRFLDAQAWKSLSVTAHKAWQERRVVHVLDDADVIHVV